MKDKKVKDQKNFIIDAKDLKIVQQLDLNPRISESKLGKLTRLSQQVVSYRIKRLKEEKIISQFGTIVNLMRLGYKQYQVLLELGNVKDSEKEELMNYLQNNHKIFWVALVGGKWDLFLIVHVRDYDEFDKLIDTLFDKFKKTIKDYESLFVIRQELYNHKFLHNTANVNLIKLKHKTYDDRIILDETDMKLLDIFRSNCRLSSLEIANKCSVSYKTIQNRIKNLEKNSVIAGYRVFMPSKIGYNAFLVLISFQSYGREEEKRMINYSRQNKFITQLWKTFGRWSIMLHVRSKTNEDLQDFIKSIKNEFPSIGSYEIIPVFRAVSLYNFSILKGMKR